MKLIALSLFCLMAANLLSAEKPARPGGANLGALGNGNGEQLFQFMDKNRDGKLTREELPRAQTFDRMDANRDGAVTLEEAQLVLKRLGTEQTLPAPKSSATAAKPAEPESPRVGPEILKPADVGVGRLVPDLAFTDLDGRRHTLGEFKDRKAVVIAVTGTSCPVSKRYLPALARMEKEFAAKNVAFVFVNPTESDAVADMRTAVKDNALTGPYVHDREQQLAKALGAATTTEVFVIDAARTLVYRGAVSDQYGLAYSQDAADEEFLRDALVALLSGQTPLIAATTAPGCALETKSVPTLAGETTYHNRISRILQNNCVECHRAGGVGPFALDSYEAVKSHAAMMRKQVDRGAMPPWFAAPVGDGAHTPWINDRSLSAEDKRDLLAWLASDKPVGNPSDAPLPRVFPEGWQIGKPDMIVQIPTPVAIKAEGFMPYHNVTVDVPLTEDKWVQSFEVQPTAREVVHHVLVFVRPPIKPGEKNFDDRRAEQQGFFAAYVPGNAFRIHEAGFAKKLPAGSRLHFQIHYTPTGKATKDQTRVGFTFASQPPEHVVQVAGIVNVMINIPPGEANHPEVATLRVPMDAYVTAFMPHMHVRGKAFKYEAEFSDGRKQVLLDIPRYDFNWQLSYQLAEPVKLPAGTVIRATAHFDNSSGNPANPDPTATVRWGQQTVNEMMIGYIEYFTPNDGSIGRMTGLRRRGGQ